MGLTLHHRVPSDLMKIMDYYGEVSGPELAAEFYREFQRVTSQVAERPGAFAERERGLRRANLRRFPYHFLFRANGSSVRVLVVRHHRRDPSFGISRR